MHSQELALEDSLSTEFCQLSLNVISGTDEGESFKVRALVQNKVMLILIDSGSSHSFVSKSFIDKMGIESVPAVTQHVGVANGQILITDHKVPQLTWWTNGYTLQHDMKVLNMTAYDAILGFDWLKSHSPMYCDWEQKTMEFQHQCQLVKLKGMLQSPVAVQEVPVEKVLQWAQGNDVWAMSVVEEIQDMPPVTDNKELQQLLQEFQDIFQAPVGLPPPRFYDHQIPLLPGAAPVNSRHYKYSPQHKDEIERQVSQLLEDGLITRSSSPFIPPVLLVLKKDGSWRMCVWTIGNSIPLPSRIDYLCL